MKTSRAMKKSSTLFYMICKHIAIVVVIVINCSSLSLAQPTPKIFGSDTVWLGTTSNYSVGYYSCMTSQLSWSVCYFGSAVGPYNGTSSVNIKWVNASNPGSNCIITVFCNGTQIASKTVYIRYSPPVAGTISPQQAFRPSGNTHIRISSSPYYGGVCAGSSTVQWQSSTDGVNFGNISSSSPDYIDVYPTVTTYYRKRYVCGTTAYSNIARVTVYPALSNNTISWAITDSIAWGGEASITGSVPLNGNCGNNYGYLWEYSEDGYTYSKVNLENGFGLHFAGIFYTTTWLRRKVYCGTDTSISNAIEVKVKKYCFNRVLLVLTKK